MTKKELPQPTDEQAYQAALSVLGEISGDLEQIPKEIRNTMLGEQAILAAENEARRSKLDQAKADYEIITNFLALLPTARDIVTEGFSSSTPEHPEFFLARSSFPVADLATANVLSANTIWSRFTYRTDYGGRAYHDLASPAFLVGSRHITKKRMELLLGSPAHDVDFDASYRRWSARDQVVEGGLSKDLVPSGIHKPLKPRIFAVEMGKRSYNHLISSLQARNNRSISEDVRRRVYSTGIWPNLDEEVISVKVKKDAPKMWEDPSFQIPNSRSIKVERRRELSEEMLADYADFGVFEITNNLRDLAIIFEKVPEYQALLTKRIEDVMPRQVGQPGPEGGISSG